MQNIVKTLKTAWDEKFGKDLETDRRSKKILTAPDGRNFFQVIHSQKLQEFYESPIGKTRYEKPECFFCAKHDEYSQLQQIARFRHLGIYFNLKFVDRYHFLIAPDEHRELPTQEDITALRELSLIFPGLSIFGNFKDSGASYERHIHFQSLFIAFPSIKLTSRNIFSNSGSEAKILNYPVALFHFPMANEESMQGVDKVVTKLPQPYNPLFYNGNSFILPRTKSVPFNTDGAKFAAAEVYGCAFTRTRELYEKLNYEIMLEALKDVGIVFGSQGAGNYEESITTALKEV